MMNKRKKIGGGFIPDLEEYERENQIKAAFGVYFQSIKEE